MRHYQTNRVQGIVDIPEPIVKDAAKSGSELQVIDMDNKESVVVTPIELWEMIERGEYKFAFEGPIYSPTDSKLIWLMGHSWFKLLKDEFQKDYMKKLSSFVKQERNKYTVYPKPDHVFRALRLTNPYKIKVLIVGQDPYPDGSADGLAFSATGRGSYVPPSLRVIKDNLEQTEGYSNSTLHLGNDLSKWAKQGVLLLNTCLTVRHGEPGSHRNQGWETFVKRVIETVNAHNNHVVVMLWGKQAQQFMDSTNPGHLILTAPHPAYIARQNQIWEHTHFIEANQFLIKKTNFEINW